MRILRLDLLRFGPFTDAVLELDSGGHGLSIIYGPNEAGKTSALRALRQFFYGIPHTSTDNFLHDNQQIRIGARLQNGDGQILECIRRKGRTNTLRAADDNAVVDPALLDQLLGGLGEKLFEQMFGIDHAMLVQGGREIVEGHGEIGQMLFAAGAGISDLRAIQQQLEQEAEALFKARGSVPQINALLSDLAEARKTVRDAQLPSKTWVEHDQAWREACSRRQNVESELLGLGVRRQQLQRLQGALPAIAARKRLHGELAALADVPILRKDFTTQRVEAQSKLEQAQIAERQAGQTLAEIDAALAAIDVPLPLLDHAAEIEQLQKDLGSHQKAMRDRPQREAEHRQLLAEAAATLRTVRPDLSLDEVERLRLTSADQTRISNLGMRQEVLAKVCRDAQLRLADIRRQLEQGQAALTELPPARDAADARKAVSRAQQQGPLEEQLRQLTEQLQDLRRQAELDIAKLRMWSGDLTEIESLPVPAIEVIDGFADRVQAMETELKSLRSRLAEEQSAAADTSAELATLRLDQEVPTEDDLIEARRKRDEGWQLVERAWRGGQDDPQRAQPFVAAFSPARDLAEAYAAAVERADYLADRLRREARRVTKQAHLLAEQQQQSHRLAQLAEQIDTAEAEAASVATHWAELWQAAAISPRQPREMRAWRQQQSALLAVARECRELQTGIDRLTRRIDASRQELADRLRELGQGAAESESLGGLIARCRDVVAEIEQVDSSRSELKRELSKLEAALPVAESEAGAANDERRGWRQQWTSAMQRLGLADDATAAEANAVLKGITELFRTLEQAAAIGQRIEDIDRDARAFAGRVHELAGRIAPALADIPVEAVAAELNVRLTRARAAQQQAVHLGERREKECEAQRLARQTVEAMQARLAGCCQEARCQRPEDLPAAEERSARKQELQKELWGVEQQLHERCAGSPLEELLTQAERVEVDQLALEIARYSEQISALATEKERLLGVISSEKTLLGQMDGSARAAEAAEHAQSLLAALRSHVEQYARTRLASAVLRKAIERYRERNQDPILKRASELFAELTVGAFQSLRADVHEKGHPVLVGVRSGTSEHVGVECMSEGTADQLYLALRLASLERYLDHKEPVPFVVDDILVQFDNERSAATLRALARLARRTQVIFFTHHEHLLDLAERHLVPGDWSVHRLQAPIGGRLIQAAQSVASADLC